MNYEQIKGIVERIATVVVSWAIGRGYVPPALGGDLTMILVLAFGVAWAWKVNTPTALADAAKAVK